MDIVGPEALEADWRLVCSLEVSLVSLVVHGLISNWYQGHPVWASNGPPCTDDLQTGDDNKHPDRHGPGS